MVTLLGRGATATSISTAAAAALEIVTFLFGCTAATTTAATLEVVSLLHRGAATTVITTAATFEVVTLLATRSATTTGITTAATLELVTARAIATFHVLGTAKTAHTGTLTTFATSLVVRERPPQGTPDRRTAAATLAHVGRHQGPEPELHHGVEHKGCKQGPRDHGRQGLPRVVVHGIHVQAQQERHSHQGAHKWSPRENITIIIVHDQFHRVTQQDTSGGADVRGQVRGPWLTKAEYM